MATINIPDLSALTLGLSILLSTYTSYLSSTPPNPTPYDSKQPDSLSATVSPTALFIRHLITVSLGLYHVFLCLTYHSPPQATCPHPEHLSSHLFTWTPHTIFYITIILLGCYIRLSAFSALGTDFTFRLAPPKKLVTSGLYHYIQHPSYTGKALTLLGNGLLMQRPDGPLGCLLPGWAVNATWFWRGFALVYVYGAARVAWKRVRQEEGMLKAKFGKEWEVYHARTKRLIPGVF